LKGVLNIMSIIEVKNLIKEFKIQKRESGFWGTIKSLFIRKYEFKNAVDGITFNIEEGEIVGYIGANGAGKSTTIKMLVGILEPTNGCVKINGSNPTINRIQNAMNMGVVFGHRTQLWWDIPLIESLQLMKYMYKIPKKKFESNLDYYIEVLGLSEFLHIPVRQLSLGQRMRAELCVALLHEPQLLYLDEPTIGLDAMVKENIRNAIREINKTKRVTVILTTHDMSDIEKLCNRVIVIDKGKIIYDGGLINLKEKYGSTEKMIITLNEITIKSDEFKNWGIEIVEESALTLTLIYDSKKINSAFIINNIIKKGYIINDFVVKKMELEEVIRKVYNIGKDVEVGAVK
jgi:ABC-2 type transport system ATP-binding protein